MLTKFPHCAFAGNNFDTSMTSAFVFNALIIIHIKGNTVNIPAMTRINIFPNVFPIFPKTSMLFSNAGFLSDALSLSIFVIDENVFLVPNPVYLFSFTIFCCIFLSLSKVSFMISNQISLKYLAVKRILTIRSDAGSFLLHNSQSISIMNPFFRNNKLNYRQQYRYCYKNYCYGCCLSHVIFFKTELIIHIKKCSCRT